MSSKQVSYYQRQTGLSFEDSVLNLESDGSDDDETLQSESEFDGDESEESDEEKKNAKLQKRRDEKREQRTAEKAMRAPHSVIQEQHRKFLPGTVVPLQDANLDGRLEKAGEITKGEYVTTAPRSGLLLFIAILTWERAEEGEEMAQEASGVYPMTWISKCGKYLKVPPGDWYCRSSKQCTEKNFRTNLVPKSYWPEYDISRYFKDIAYYDLQAAISFCDRVLDGLPYIGMSDFEGKIINPRNYSAERLLTIAQSKRVRPFGPHHVDVGTKKRTGRNQKQGVQSAGGKAKPPPKKRPKQNKSRAEPSTKKKRTSHTKEIPCVSDAEMEKENAERQTNQLKGVDDTACAAGAATETAGVAAANADGVQQLEDVAVQAAGAVLDEYHDGIDASTLMPNDDTGESMELDNLVDFLSDNEDLRRILDGGNHNRAYQVFGHGENDEDLELSMRDSYGADHLDGDENGGEMNEDGAGLEDRRHVNGGVVGVDEFSTARNSTYTDLQVVVSTEEQDTQLVGLDDNDGASAVVHSESSGSGVEARSSVLQRPRDGDGAMITPTTESSRIQKLTPELIVRRPPELTPLPQRRTDSRASSAPHQQGPGGAYSASSSMKSSSVPANSHGNNMGSRSNEQAPPNNMGPPSSGGSDGDSGRSSTNSSGVNGNLENTPTTALHANGQPRFSGLQRIALMEKAMVAFQAKVTAQTVELGNLRKMLEPMCAYFKLKAAKKRNEMLTYVDAPRNHKIALPCKNADELFSLNATLSNELAFNDFKAYLCRKADSAVKVEAKIKVTFTRLFAPLLCTTYVWKNEPGEDKPALSSFDNIVRIFPSLWNDPHPNGGSGWYRRLCVDMRRNIAKHNRGKSLEDKHEYYKAYHHVYSVHTSNEHIVLA